MIVHRVVNTVYKSCTYLLIEDQRTWIVDCGDVDRLLPLVQGQLCGVLLTHAHFDHIYGLNTLLSLYPSLPVVTNEYGLNGLNSDKLNFSRYYGDPFVLDSADNVRLVQDGEQIPLFADIDARAVFTPGHSPDCITWIAGDAVFTGDSYIPGVKTVTNIPHSDKELAAHSEAVIRELSMERLLYPGHAPESVPPGLLISED